MEERRERGVHAVCRLHRIVISKAPPPTTLTPVAEKNINSCMAGGWNCMRGQRAEGRCSLQMQSSCSKNHSAIVEFSVGLWGSLHTRRRTQSDIQLARWGSPDKERQLRLAESLQFILRKCVTNEAAESQERGLGGDIGSRGIYFVLQCVRVCMHM